MISASKENLDHYLSAGTYKSDKLNVSSFKVYADGALGSRKSGRYRDGQNRPENKCRKSPSVRHRKNTPARCGLPKRSILSRHSRGIMADGARKLNGVRP